nr:MAG TPA: hypothetical protein [Caudoviricetes sp.]
MAYIPHFCQFPNNTHLIYLTVRCTRLRGICNK